MNLDSLDSIAELGYGVFVFVLEHSFTTSDEKRRVSGENLLLPPCNHKLSRLPCIRESRLNLSHLGVGGFSLAGINQLFLFWSSLLVRA